MSEATRVDATRGVFIVLEGIDGSGTTSQGDELTQYLRGLGEKVLFTHEPSAGPAGSLIRLALARRLVGPSSGFHDEESQPEFSTSLDQKTFALLFAADRMDHVATEIEPALARGRHVICDRYLLSSLAYQGVELDADWILEINRLAPVPDITILLDVSAATAKTRMSRTRWSKDIFEEEAELRRVGSLYLEMVDRYRSHLGRIEILDASQELWKVRREIERLVDPFFPTKDDAET